MWRKTLGFALLTLLFVLTLQGCYSHRRAYGYRDDYVPGYVRVRVNTSHRHHDHYRDDGRHFRKFKHNYYYQEHGRRHR